MYEAAIPILAFVSVTAIGGAVLLGYQARRKVLQNRLCPVPGGLSAPAPTVRSPLTAVQRLAGALAIGRATPRLKQELANAGYMAASAAQVYLGLKTLLLVVGATGLTVVLFPLDAPLQVRIVLIAGGAAALSLVPNAVVRIRRHRRREEVRRQLPHALDLLEIGVSSGMGMDMAWNAVTDEVRPVSPSLADEMALTNLELHLGAPRADAMRRMAGRTGVEEVSSLVAVLVQSERFGTSMTDALRTFAASMRENRSQRAAEAAEKTAVKLLFPLVLFIFPAILVVSVGPAAIVLSQALGGSAAGTQ